MWKTLEIIGFEQSTKLQPYFQKRPTADGFQVKNRIFRRTKGNVGQRIILSASVAEFSNQNPRLIVCRAILHYRPTLGGQFAISLLFLCRTVDIQSCFFFWNISWNVQSPIENQKSSGLSVNFHKSADGPPIVFYRIRITLNINRPLLNKQRLGGRHHAALIKSIQRCYIWILSNCGFVYVIG